MELPNCWVAEREDALRPLVSHGEEYAGPDKRSAPDQASTFIVTSLGNSMIGAFIPPKATLLVDRSVVPHNGHIVAALVNGELTVRFLQKNDYFSRLIPASRRYPELKITPDMNVKILGVVTRIIIDPKEVAQCRL